MFGYLMITVITDQTIILTLALIGVFALLLGRTAGVPGLFVGMVIGASMAFMAGLIPLWLLILISVSMLTLTGFAIWGKSE